ncbi:unnamed protein product [Vitrella brassicaformis CCMP3155]|uniref:Uncharacterized protein n=2 Tax=Vitrella brassicaformis TaxID=1169539 RepID=A0A0G4FZD1_VITBC|nr:unnamed protein product [Vitrella brassicaformis CCMP3155]|eukprot:CEM20883.1 unnamed protein product [Vitrella brassicaformis CCMP3155]
MGNEMSRGEGCLYPPESAQIRTPQFNDSAGAADIVYVTNGGGCQSITRCCRHPLTFQDYETPEEALSRARFYRQRMLEEGRPSDFPLALHAYGKCREMMLENLKYLAQGSHVVSTDSVEHNEAKRKEIELKLAEVCHEIGEVTLENNLHDDRDVNEKALLFFREACDHDPSSYAHWYKRGGTHQKMNQDNEALDCFQIAHERDPHSVGALFGMGVVKKKHNKFQEAHHMFEQVLRLQPDNRGGLNMLADLSEKLGCPEEALDYCRRLHSLEPTDRELVIKIRKLETQLGVQPLTPLPPLTGNIPSNLFHSRQDLPEDM